MLLSRLVNTALKTTNRKINHNPDHNRVMVSLSIKGKRDLHSIPAAGCRTLSTKQLKLIVTQSIMTRQNEA